MAAVTAWAIFLALCFLNDLVITHNEVQASLLGFSGPSAFSTALISIAYWEDLGVGITASTLNSPTDRYYVFYNSCQMLVVDIFLYSFLLLYLDRVVPTDHGRREPLWYPCAWLSRLLGCLAAEEESLQLVELEGSADHFEPAHFESLPVVKIRNLCKSYGATDAVKNLNLDLYSGQVYCLLGHNGAGKSTTVNVLTGLTAPTSGGAWVKGKSIGADLGEVRRNIGLCPQHDLLFNLLTVNEHLQFFANLRAISNAQPAIDHLLQKFDLTAKKHEYAQSLSGGMKRKLSCSMALIGNSSLVILDEPTSGMDPVARRQTWEVIKEYKQDRVIILSTHYISGSPFFLKQSFKEGYSLTVTVKSPDFLTELDTLVASYVGHIPGYCIKSRASTETVYHLPFNTDKLSELLKELNNVSDFLVHYGISSVTLEEIFRKINSASEVEVPDVGELPEVNGGLSIQTATEPRYAVLNDHVDVSPEAHENKTSFCRQLLVLIWKRAWIAARNWTTFVCQILLPTVFFVLGLHFLKLNYYENQPALVLTPEIQGEEIPLLTNSYNSSGVKGIFQDQENKQWLAGGESIEHTAKSAWADQFYTNFTLVNWEETLSKVGWNIPSDEPQLLLSLYNDQSMFPNWIIAGSNYSSYHGLPISYNLISTSAYRYLRQDAGVRVTVVNHPLPVTSSQYQEEGDVTGVLQAIFLACGFCFVPAGFIATLVRERQLRVKQQQLISGVNILIYHVSNFVWDFTMMLIPTAICAFFIWIWDVDKFTGDAFLPCIINMLLFAASITPFTYLLCFIFKNSSTAQAVLTCVYLVSAIILMIGSFVMGEFPETKHLNKQLKFFYRLLPAYCMGDAFLALSARDIAILWSDQSTKGVWDWDVTGLVFTYMAGQFAVYFILLFLVEYYLSNPLHGRVQLEPPAGLLELREEEEDVAAERRRVLAGCADSVRLKGLRKVYNGQTVAVQDLYFGVQKGEIFGFLGPNGAGKTTTLKMLCGFELPSRGEAFLGGHSIIDQFECRKLIGYCPQFDALFPRLTVWQHLAFYGAIKGVPASVLPARIDKMISRLALDEYRVVLSKNLSGGNKRKLSVAIALIGNPAVVLLDEPSCGMDPVSRRFMWDFLREQTANQAVILTTHLMEECEALASRIGIMCNGRLECFGTSQHLKSRWGSDFQLDIKMVEPNIETIQSNFEQTFGRVTLLEDFGLSARFGIQLETKTLFRVFEYIEKMKHELKINTYALSQPSLDQVFVRFANNQVPEDN